MAAAPKLLISTIPKLFRIEAISTKGSLALRRLDFDLEGFESDYPRVMHILFRPQKPALQVHAPYTALALADVQEVDWPHGRLQVADLNVLHPFDRQSALKAVLLSRDILDAYILDLEGLSLKRANDLLLDDSQGLRLTAVDTSAQGLLRRLSAGLYRGAPPSALLDWKYAEFLRGDPHAVQEGAIYHRRIERLPAGEIASLADSLPYLHAAELVSLLPIALGADTLELMSPERQLQVFEELEEGHALSILEKMAPDIATDLIGRLTVEQARRTLDSLPAPYDDRIIDLLRYPEDTVGGMMTNDIIALPAALTVSEARLRLRSQIQEPDFVYFLYVIDNDVDRRLQGVLTLRSILVAADNQRLEEIMNPYLETLSPLDSPRQAAYRLIRSQLAALPVTASNGRLLGVMTVDTAVNLVAPGAWSSQAPRIFS